MCRDPDLGDRVRDRQAGSVKPLAADRGGQRRPGQDGGEWTVKPMVLPADLVVRRRLAGTAGITPA